MQNQCQVLSDLHYRNIYYNISFTNISIDMYKLFDVKPLTEMFRFCRWQQLKQVSSV